MVMKKLLMTAALLAASAVSANAGINVVEAPSGFFAPGSSATYNSPYYRDQSGDWGWQHGALADQDLNGSAILRISAFDVDFAQGEFDRIYVGTDTSGILLGDLQGVNDAYAFTDFVLTGPVLLGLVQSGLSLYMNIDAGNSGWLVTLGRSVLCSNATDVSQCVADANPDVPVTTGVPEPLTLSLFGAGLAGAAAMRRRRKA